MNRCLQNASFKRFALRDRDSREERLSYKIYLKDCVFKCWFNSRQNISLLDFSPNGYFILRISNYLMSKLSYRVLPIYVFRYRSIFLMKIWVTEFCVLWINDKIIVFLSMGSMKSKHWVVHANDLVGFLLVLSWHIVKSFCCLPVSGLNRQWQKFMIGIVMSRVQDGGKLALHWTHLAFGYQ